MRAADAALLIVALMVAWSLYRAHRSRDFKFDLFDIIMDNGKISRLACVFIGSFLVMSWVLIRATIDGKLTDTLYAAYGTIWVAPIIAKLFSAPPPPGTITTDSKITTTQTIEKPRQGEVG